MAEDREIDWLGIEREYRAGILSLRGIADQFGVTEGAIRKRAKRDDWVRDLSQKIKAKADQLVRSGEVRKEYAMRTEKDTVEANARMQADIIIGHRADVRKARSITQDHFKELEADKTLELKEKATIGKILTESLKTQIGLEREAFGISDNANGDADKTRPITNVTYTIIEPNHVDIQQAVVTHSQNPSDRVYS